MRDLQEVAKRFLSVREEYHRLRQMDALRMPAIGRRLRDEREAQMRMLAWVLGIDPDVVDNTQALPSGMAPVERVTLTQIDGADVWLLEVPAVDGPGWQNEYFGVPLTSQHVRELVRALPDVMMRLAGRGRVHIAILSVPLPVPAQPSRWQLVEPDLPPGA